MSWTRKCPVKRKNWPNTLDRARVSCKRWRFNFAENPLLETGRVVAIHVLEAWTWFGIFRRIDSTHNLGEDGAPPRTQQSHTSFSFSLEKPVPTGCSTLVVNCSMLICTILSPLLDGRSYRAKIGQMAAHDGCVLDLNSATVSRVCTKPGPLIGQAMKERTTCVTIGFPFCNNCKLQCQPTALQP